MTHTQVRITAEQLDKLRALAERERRSMAAQLAILIDEAVGKSDAHLRSTQGGQS